MAHTQYLRQYSTFMDTTRIGTYGCVLAHAVLAPAPAHHTAHFAQSQRKNLEKAQEPGVVLHVYHPSTWEAEAGLL